MATMLLDHLRYLWPQADALFVVGRMAFPLFCLVMGCHVARLQRAPAALGRYLMWLMVFSVVSELAYRSVEPASATLNILPTLVLGLAVAAGIQRPEPWWRALGLGCTAIAIIWSPVLMYGWPGVLLPAACTVAVQRGGLAWTLPMGLAVAANLTNSWLQDHMLAPFTLTVLGTAALTLPLADVLLRHGVRSPVLPVGRWGYAFYPGHLLLIGLIQRGAG